MYRLRIPGFYKNSIHSLFFILLILCIFYICRIIEETNIAVSLVELDAPPNRTYVKTDGKLTAQPQTGQQALVYKEHTHPFHLPPNHGIQYLSGEMSTNLCLTNFTEVSVRQDIQHASAR